MRIAFDSKLLVSLHRMISSLTARQEQMKAKVLELQETNRALSASARELYIANLELSQANRYKSEFISAISHEMKTPLNAIIGFSELLQDRIPGDLNEKQARHVENIHKSGIYLLRIVNDMLDLSGIESASTKLHLDEFSILEAIASAEALARPLATRKQIHLDSRVDENLTTIVADAAKFKNVMYNLLSNAVKFTPERGSIRIEATRANNCVQVAVSDSGIGIKPEDKELIFDGLRALDAARIGQEQGTGIGLTLVKRIVELHGGKIWVETELDKGSTFVFALPLKPQLADEPRE